MIPNILRGYSNSVAKTLKYKLLHTPWSIPKLAIKKQASGKWTDFLSYWQRENFWSEAIGWSPADKSNQNSFFRGFLKGLRLSEPNIEKVDTTKSFKSHMNQKKSR